MKVKGEQSLKKA